MRRDISPPVTITSLFTDVEGSTRLRDELAGERNLRDDACLDGCRKRARACAAAVEKVRPIGSEALEELE